MINTTAILACLQGVVGWRNSDDPCYPDLNPSLSSSSTGLYYSDVNALMGMDVLHAIKSEKTSIDDYLTRITDDSILKVINNFVAMQSASTYAKQLLKDRSIINGAGSVWDKENKLGRFVGFEFTPTAYTSIQALIKKVALQLDTIQSTPLKLYVYSITQDEPVKVIELENNRINYPEWFDLVDTNEVLFTGNGPFYIGYYEEDLQGNAIRRGFSGAPCNCANDPYTSYSPFFKIRAISIPSEAINDGERPLFDTTRIVYESSNFGLNFEPFVYCDISSVICENKELFAEAIRLMVASRVMTEIIASPEVSRITSSVKSDAYALNRQLQLELFGGYDKESSIAYKGELKKLEVNFTGMDKACLPAKKSLLSMSTLVR